MTLAISPMWHWMGTLGRKKSRKGLSVDKSVLRYGVPERVRNRKHLDWIRTLPCCMSGSPPPSDPAHISAENGKGVACKVGDDNTVPLSWTEHRRQHAVGERSYWGSDLDRAKALGKALYVVSGDGLKGLQLITEYRIQKDA